MIELLRSWEFWVIIIVVFIIIAWLICGGESVKPRFDTLHTREFLRGRTGRVHVGRSLRDYTLSIPDAESISEIISESISEETDPIDDVYSDEGDGLFESSSSRYSSTHRSLSRHDVLMDSIVLPPEKHVIKWKKGPHAVEYKGGKQSKAEGRCKEIVRKIWPDHEFITVRPPWLKNPSTGRCLELDMYNEELGIAIEYNGRQHYEYVPHFHRGGRGDLIKQVERDNLKLDLCDKVGVRVITVPYYVKDSEIEALIRFQSPYGDKFRR